MGRVEENHCIEQKGSELIDEKDRCSNVLETRGTVSCKSHSMPRLQVYCCLPHELNPFPISIFASNPIGDCNPASGDINQPTLPPTSPLRNGIPSPLAPQFKLALQIETKSQSASQQKHHHPNQLPAFLGPNWELELKTNGYRKWLTYIVLISNIPDYAGDQRNVNKSHPCSAWRPAEVLVTI